MSFTSPVEVNIRLRGETSAMDEVHRPSQLVGNTVCMMQRFRRRMHDTRRNLEGHCWREAIREQLTQSRSIDPIHRQEPRSVHLADVGHARQSVMVHPPKQTRLFLQGDEHGGNPREVRMQTLDRDGFRSGASPSPRAKDVGRAARCDPLQELVPAKWDRVLHRAYRPPGRLQLSSIRSSRLGQEKTMRPSWWWFAICAVCAMLPASLSACGEDPALGEPCDDGCGELDCLGHPSFPGGVCTQVCGSCPPGSECASGYGTPVCLPRCGSPADCIRDFLCFEGVCRPPCSTSEECGGDRFRCIERACAPTACNDDSQCPTDQSCRLGICTSFTAAGDLPVGSTCSRATDCDTLICLDDSRGGVCAQPCAARSECEPSQVCAPVPVDLDADGSFDAAPGACFSGDGSLAFVGSLCATGSDCETQTCLDGLCTRACRDASECLPGQTCVESRLVDAAVARVCGFDPVGDTGRTDRVDLGTVPALGGTVGSVSLAVPPDAVSVTLIGAAETSNQIFGFESVEDVTGSIYSVADLLQWIDQPVRWLPQDTFEHIQLSIPSSTPDRIRLAPGRLSVSLFSVDTATNVALAALVKRAPGSDVAGGRLNLNLFLVDVGLTPAAAQNDVTVQTALMQLRDIFRPANIELGEINYIETTTPEATELSIIDSVTGPDSEMARLFRLSAGRTETAINIFFVRAIVESLDGSVALGIAGGIPGPPAIHGTGHSGVVVAVDPAVVGVGSDAGRIVGQIMAHEIGHYLGLFHTRERSAPCSPGTGPTPTNSCAPFGGEDVIPDTQADDGANLMWYSVGGADGRTFNIDLTSGQAFVLRRSPVVQP